MLPPCHKLNPNFSGGGKKNPSDWQPGLCRREAYPGSQSPRAHCFPSLPLSLSLAFTALKSEWQDAAFAVVRIFKQNTAYYCQLCLKGAGTFFLLFQYLQTPTIHMILNWCHCYADPGLWPRPRPVSTSIRATSWWVTQSRCCSESQSLFSPLWQRSLWFGTRTPLMWITTRRESIKERHALQV